MGSSLQVTSVLDRKTGELVPLDAPTEHLAEWVTNLKDLRGELADAEQQVADELLRRLDRDACWTVRVGDPFMGEQWEIKAPSPTAGTDAYDPLLLEQELRQLVTRGAITEDAAAGALRRVLTIKLSLPFGVSLKDAEHATREMTFRIDGVVCELLDVAVSHASVAAGINRLRKVPGTGAALDRAKASVDPPRRRPSVTLHTRETR